MEISPSSPRPGPRCSLSSSVNRLINTRPAVYPRPRKFSSRNRFPVIKKTFFCLSIFLIFFQKTIRLIPPCIAVTTFQAAGCPLDWKSSVHGGLLPDFGDDDGTPRRQSRTDSKRAWNPGSPDDDSWPSVMDEMPPPHSQGLNPTIDLITEKSGNAACVSPFTI